MKFDYLNRYFAKGGESLGHSRSYGAHADSPEEALAIAFEAARNARKIMGFPIEIETQIFIRREYK